MKIGALSVRNPVLVNILMVITLVLGVITINRIPREQFSEVPFYFVIITVPYPGVSANDVERTVTAEIEKEMQGLELLDTIQSESFDGLSQVNIGFKDDITGDQFDRLYQEVQTSIYQSRIARRSRERDNR